MRTSLRVPVFTPRRMLTSAVVCLLVSLGSARASVAGAAQSGGSGSTPAVSTTLEQCVTAAVQSERSVTFAAEMTAIPGTVRMSMRFDVEAREPGEAFFHVISGSGLGGWRSSDAKVKTYRYLKQVTNLASPAVYRALVHFRWVNARGHSIKRTERLTPRCAQLATPVAPSPPPADGTSTGSTGLSSPT